MSDTGSRNGGTVDQLLLESGLDDDGGLRPVLLELRALAGDQPEPSAAVAALMSPVLMSPASGRQEAAGPASQPAPAAAGAVTDELAARRRAKRRITLTSLSVAVSLAAGGAVAVASDQGIRDSIGQLNHAVTSFVTTGNGGPANTPAGTPDPVPVAPGGSAPVPAPTAPVLPQPAATAPAPGTTHGPENLPAPASPAIPLPELPVPGDVAPAVPGTPGNGEGHPPVVPLPAAPPVPVPGVQPQ